MEREHNKNRLGTYEGVPASHVPRDANFISSHTLLKAKSQEDDELEMNARFLLHGNRHKQKDVIRRDSAAAYMTVFCLVISVELILGLTFGVADITGAYMECEPATRHLYVRPLKEWKPTGGMLWMLLKLAYGIVEVGWQWLKPVETWMIEDAEVEKVIGVSQLFLERDQAKKVTLLMAKTTDGFLVSDTPEEFKHFMDELSVRYEVVKIRFGQDFHFNACEVTFNNHGDATLSMGNYMRRLNPIQLSGPRRQGQEAKADTREEAESRNTHVPRHGNGPPSLTCHVEYSATCWGPACQAHHRREHIAPRNLETLKKHYVPQAVKYIRGDPHEPVICVTRRQSVLLWTNWRYMQTQDRLPCMEQTAVTSNFVDESQA